MSDLKQYLLKKIKDHTAVIGILGMGYVGLPLAIEAAKSGYDAIGFDVDIDKVAQINAGCSYINDVTDSDLQSVLAAKRLSATTDFALIEAIDIAIICVPTPLDRYQQPDISYLKESVATIALHLHHPMLIILESTTYPGTTEELLKPVLESSGLVCGQDFYLAFSPERVDPGNQQYHTKNTPKVVGGVGQAATETAAALYRMVLDSEVFEVSSPMVAEMEKLLENTYRNINISLVNELAKLCERMGVDVWEVIEAAATKPYGFQRFHPGPGIGGHCIPLDPFYLSWKAREYGCPMHLIETAGEINRAMPEYIVQRTMRILNQEQIALRGAEILVLGVAYKSDVNDYRESPALYIIESLKKLGAHVSFYDPYITKCKWKDAIYEGEKELSPERLRQADLVMICTAHSTWDYAQIQRLAKVIFDTRNAMKDVAERGNIEVL